MKNNKINAVGLINWIKRDWYVLIVLLFALLACVYTYNHVNNYVDSCNEHWLQQIQPIIDRCFVSEYDQPMFNDFNISINLNEGVD